MSLSRSLVSVFLSGALLIAALFPAAALATPRDGIDGNAEWEKALQTAPEIRAAILQEDPTEADLERFATNYAPLLSNPFYAHALADSVSVHELYAFALRASTDPTFTRFHNGSARNDVLTSIGTTLVLITGGRNVTPDTMPIQEAFDTFRDAPSTPDSLTSNKHVQRAVADCIAAGNTRYYVGEFNPTRLGYTIDGYSLFTQLTGAAATVNPGLVFGPEVYLAQDDVSSLATSLVAWDYKKSYHPEGPRISFLHNSPVTAHGAVVLDPLHTLYILSNTPPALTGAVLQRGEGERLKALRAFLATMTPFRPDLDHDGELHEKGEPVIGMVRYLTGHRTDASRNFFGFQDSGEAFGAMIFDATRRNDSLEDKKDDRHYAEIITQFLAGYQDGLDEDHSFLGFGDRVDGQDIYGYHNFRLRSWVGPILAPYLSGLTTSLREPGDSLGAQVGRESEHAGVGLDYGYGKKLFARNSLFSDLVFDQPAIADEGDPADVLDDTYVGGRPPALTLLRVAAFEGYLSDVEAILAGDRHAGRSEAMDDVVTRWGYLTHLFFTVHPIQEHSVRAAEYSLNRTWDEGVGKLVLSASYEDLASHKLSRRLLKEVSTPVVGADFSDLRPPEIAHVSVRTAAEQYDASRYMTSIFLTAAAHSNSWFWIDFETPLDLTVRHADASFVGDDGRVLPYNELDEEAKEEFFHFVLYETDVSGAGAARSVLKKAETIRWNITKDLNQGGESRDNE
ncbi:MAG: hypothetical protein CSA82_01455 [Actinobacteria bacterium]|nr:MAG: hypothetical protein CSA82_01455 [Actinomycetota bacterium]